MARRRGKIMGFDMGTDMNLLLLGGGAIAIYFLGQKFNLWGGSSSSQEASVTATQNATTTAAAVQQLTAQGQTPGYSDQQYETWAQAIYAEGNVLIPSSDSSGTILAIFNQLNDQIDVVKLVGAFGTKTVNFFWTYDLGGYLHAAYSPSAVAAFNQQLAYNNANYSF